MTKIIDIEGIGPAYAEKLKAVGISSTAALLKQGASPQSRQEIAAKTGIGDSLILRWVNHADLFRIKGVAGQYSELLEAAGVDSVKELAQRNPKNLLETLVQVNAEKKCVRRPPTAAQVASWVAQAKKLPRAINY